MEKMNILPKGQEGGLPLKGSTSRWLQENNFDLLRFLFAFTVFLVHSHSLSGAVELSFLSELFSSDLAVKSFFVVSGFLIFMSYEKSSNAFTYFAKRIRRIYPAYFFVVISCVILWGFFASYLSGIDTWVQVFYYALANLVFLNFLQPDLPNLFDQNIFQAVNGALWTLKIEVMFYVMVPFVVLAFKRFGHARVLGFLYLCSLGYFMLMDFLIDQNGSGLYVELQRQLPGQLTYFLGGAAGYYFFEHFRKNVKWLVPLVVISFLLKAWLPWDAVQPVALAVLVVFFACVFPYLGNFSKYGDFSYGIYIVHFPILQLLIASGFFNTSPWLLLSTSAALVMGAAFLLWQFIEKTFLNQSSHYATPGVR